MAEDWGAGVSRTLSALMRNFSGIVWQDGKPPLDSELNLMSQVEIERLRQEVRAVMPSGFFLDPTAAIADFGFNASWSNYFTFGQYAEGEQSPTIYANVNGWIIPVSGTNVDQDADLRNIIKLYPPPASDSRVDLVFLEAWMCLVAPNPSTDNKPSNTKVWKWGNVEFGGTNVDDDIEDPTVGYETTERVQIQYRIRVFGQGTALGDSVALDVYPDGLDDPNVLGQGTATAPVAGFQWANMGNALDDPSLWRAGDGDPNNDLGTIDGYSYAIPICAVFRRNEQVFVAAELSGDPNQNGAFNRNPAAKFLVDPRDGAKTLATPTLIDNLLGGVTGTIQVNNLVGSGFDDPNHDLDFVFMVIDDEIVGIDSVDTSVTPNTITIPAGGRGRYATDDVVHLAGAEIHFYNTNPDTLFSDEIAQEDILDLRRGVNPGDWDFQRLLQHNLAALTLGDLHSTWKQSGAGDTEGPVVYEVDYQFADGATSVPNHTEALDGPDGIRQVFSDAATPQPEVTVMCDNDAPLTNNFTSTQYDASVGWDAGADFRPTGFMNIGDGSDPAGQRWCNGSSIFLHIGGDTGDDGARATFRDGSTRAVRFVTPREYWKNGYPEYNPENGNQYPVLLRFLDQLSHQPMATGENDASVDPGAALKHPGPMFPWRELNFEYPYIVLGGLLNTSLSLNLQAADLSNPGGAPAQPYYEIDVSLDFDTPGGWYTLDSSGRFANDADAVSNALLRGQRTLYGMLTDDGRDNTGASSEVYLVLWGDTTERDNNGCFKVIGAGTVGYTTHSATGNGTGTASESLVLQPMDPEFVAFDDTTGNDLTGEVRSQFTNSEDGNGKLSGPAAMVIVLTDVGGLLNHPWNALTLGEGAVAPLLDFALPQDSSGRYYDASKAVVDTTLLYHPGRGATGRVADAMARYSVGNADSTYLRQAPGTIDTTFSSASGAPGQETFFDPAHVQLWNRLPSLGWNARNAPAYGGLLVSNSEQDREHELFIDLGSKTVVFRPYRDLQMTLQGLTVSLDTDSDLDAICLLGKYLYPSANPKDAAALFTGDPTSQKKMGYAVPPEYMPRFGRQDIPYYRDITSPLGSGTFLEGINHMFVDSTTLVNPVFNIIGGEDNISGGVQVKPFYFRTNDPTNYGTFSTVIGTVLNKPNYMARKAPIDINTSTPEGKFVYNKFTAVQSADLGPGLEGIQLPPYIGTARVYGVYDYDDYIAKGGRTFQSDRVTADTDPATNLLRKDADQQTLFIMQDGAADITAVVCGTVHAGDHTYVIPTEAFDITKSPYHKVNDPLSTKETFNDFDFVVEATIFGFAQGWINENNYVLARRHDSSGNTINDGDNPELEDVHMVFPFAASLNQRAFSSNRRTVYQGDPFMTRAGDTRTVTDYENRYGQVPTAGAAQLAEHMQQFDSDGNPIPQTPNLRSLEILAAMDFYTTLGTGKIGGKLYPGTMLDVGFTDDEGLSSTRIPPTNTSPAWRVLTRTYTEGQKANFSRGSVGVEFLPTTPANMDGAIVRIITIDDQIINMTATTAAPATEDEFQIVAGTAAAGLSVSANITVPASTLEYEGSYTSAVIALPGAVVGDTVTVTQDISGSLLPDGVVVDGYVSAADQVVVRFTSVEKTPDIESTIAMTTGAGGFFNAANFASGADLNGAFPVVGAVVGDTVTLTIEDDTKAQNLDGIVFDAWVDAADSVTIRAVNGGAGAVNFGAGYWAGSPDFNLELRVIKQVTGYVPTFTADFTISAGQSTMSVDGTAQSFVDAVNAHSKLEQAVRGLSSGTGIATLEAVPNGAQGNDMFVELDASGAGLPVEQLLALRVPENNERVGNYITQTPFLGGFDIPVNAGPGSSQVRLTGMVERLPLGILAQDSDFLCENPLQDTASAMKTGPGGIRPIQTLLPLTIRGESYTRFLGYPGELIAVSDGAILQYEPYNAITSPTGTKRFRLYRGGGSSFLLSGKVPGGPLDWVGDSLEPPLNPVLKGAALGAKAMLVRNYPEEAFAENNTVSHGDEIQMVIVTYAVYGDGETQTQGVVLGGDIGPAGYGEGYAAIDRYRLEGKPMYRHHTRQHPDPEDVTPVVYSEDVEGE